MGQVAVMAQKGTDDLSVCKCNNLACEIAMNKCKRGPLGQESVPVSWQQGAGTNPATRSLPATPYRQSPAGKHDRWQGEIW